MATTTNFNDWIDNLDEQDIETISHLYDSIQANTQMGEFTTKQDSQGRKFVTSPMHENTLMLATPRAETSFLNVLDYKFGGDFGWVGGHWDFVRAMQKND